MSGPLDGIVVLDLTRALAGPHAGMMLGDLGARVIKIESPGGDESRGWGPPFVGGESTYFMSCNRNKESLVLDLKDPADAAVLGSLVERADVLIENFRPGVMDRLGFSVERLHELNPRIVISSITGFGHDGPEAERAGYDQIAQGEGGLMSVTGVGEPTRAGVPIADLLAGMNSAYGVVAALFERSTTGRGRVVRTSLLAGMVGIHSFQGTRWTVAGERPALVGNHHPTVAPYGLFHTGTSPIQVACGNDNQWAALAGVLGLDAHDPRFTTNALRITNRAALISVIDGALRNAPADHWLHHLHEARVPCGKVRTIDEVYDWDQTRSQGLVIEVDHPTAGPLKLPGPTLRFDDNVYAGGRDEHLPPPTLGQHNESVREWLAST
jgi:crotonobetainyl-CoA:carnitine CoA-transferase CaiB-like acyl-CoA transferase